ncbi:MAG: AI-2E family transporter [Solobacterium sp.]|nr:AI-2E family transporter [Solobacterium sp.]
MKKWNELLEKRWVANTAAICSGVVLFMVLNHIGEIYGWFASVIKIFESVLIGLVLAYLLDPIVKYFEGRMSGRLSDGRRRSLSVLMTVVLVLVIVIGAFGIIVPALISSIRSLITVMQNETVIDNLLENLNAFSEYMHMDLSVLSGYLDEAMTYIIDYVRQNAAEIMNKTINVGTSIVNILIGFIIALYLLLDKKNLFEGYSQLRLALLGEEKYKTHNAFWKRCHEILISYIGCDLLDGVIVGAVNAVCMMLLGMPYIPLVSVVVGVTNLLPSIGPVIGAVIGSVILVFADPIYVLWFLILTVILQTIDGYIVKPKMFGNTLGIPAVFSLGSVIICGKIYGILGIFLAVPLVAILLFMYRESLLPYLRRRKHLQKS